MTRFKHASRKAGEFDARDYALRYFVLLPVLLYLIEVNGTAPRGVVREAAQALNNAAQLSGELTLAALGTPFVSLPGMIVANGAVNWFVWGCSSYLAYFAFAGLLLITRKMNWRQRASSFFFGSIAIFAANNARVSFFYLSIHFLGFGWGIFLHDISWKFLSSIFLFALWLYFAKKALLKKGAPWSGLLEESVTDLEYLVKKQLRKK